MTAPAIPADTTARLRRIRNELIAALSMDSGDEQALTAVLLEQRIDAYMRAIDKQIRLVGCQRQAARPSGEQLNELQADSARDAKSIVSTFNRDLEKNINRIVADNPDGRRGPIESAIRGYLSTRAQWKDKQIALNTSKTARAYAEEQFRQKNGIADQRYIYSGPPPVSEECQNNMAAGVVNVQYTKEHPTPAHINCPHNWAVVATETVNNCQALWVG